MVVEEATWWPCRFPLDDLLRSEVRPGRGEPAPPVTSATVVSPHGGVGVGRGRLGASPPRFRLREEIPLAVRIAAILGPLVSVLLAPPALAMTCPQWERLGPEQKAAAVDRMIQSAISGSRGRSYRVDRGAIARCLQSESLSIEYAFDDVCSDPRTAGMNAIRTTFKDYIWSCVQ